MDEQERLKREVDDAKRLSDVMYMKALMEDPFATSKWSVHLLFDHYLIWVKDKNTYVINGGNQGALDFENKVNELIGKVIGAQNIQKAYAVDALRDILHEVTHDTAGLPRDELLDVLTEVRDLAQAALEREGVL